VILAVLVTGCISYQNAANGTNIDTISVTKIPILSTNQPSTILPIFQIPCHVANNKTPWIIINPIGDQTLGNVIKINGTTNIEGGELQIFIRSIKIISCPKDASYSDNPHPCNGVFLTVPIIKENLSNNTWSREVNTSQHGFYPDEFIVEVTDLDCKQDNPRAYGFFNISSGRDLNR
jgi:hypothetical protein